MGVDCREKDNLSRFLASFPTEIDSTENELIPSRRVFWSTNSSSSDVDDVHDKIKSAFCNVYAPSFNGLIQFWKPVKTTTTSSTILSTSDQPFSLEYLNPRGRSYRLFSLDSLVSIDQVSNGPLATAFINHFPEVVVDLRVHKGLTPLVDKALDCGFTCLILLPVFSSSLCVGVVECCMKKLTTDNLLVIFDKLKDAIESVGLSTYQKPLPQMIVAKHEIEDALKVVCESHHLSLAQVWMPYPIEIYPQCMVKKGTTFVTRLCGYCHPDAYNDDDDGVMNYYDTCDMLPLKMGEGLAGMTLETHEPLFSENLSKLTRTLKKKGGLLGQLCCNTECSCLVICLRLRISLTEYVDYAFEFLWTKTRNHSILLKSLLLTLNMCLPSFHFYSGAQLGDEICVVDLDRCTRNEIASFRLSASSLKEELQRPKRKLGALYDGDDNQTESDSESDSDNCDDDLFFVADYKGTLNLLTLHSSYKLADAKQRVEKAFKLDPEAYTMMYEVDGSEVRLDTDEKLVSCIKSWRKGENGASPQQMMFTVCVRSDQQPVAG